MAIRRNLFRIYWKIEKILVPKLRFSQTVYEDVLRSSVNANTRWLDLGCGHEILPAWRLEEEKGLAESCQLIVGIDYELQALKKHHGISHRVRGGITNLPFRDNSFNLLTANMVVEHLDNPSEQFREVNRVLVPEGLFIFHTPNAHGYGTLMARMVPKILKSKLIYALDGRKEEDVFDTHYKANTVKDIEKLAQATGFEIINMKMLVTNALFAVIPR